MANTRSAAKQARADLRRHTYNQRRISGLKTLQKNLRALVLKGEKEAAAKLFLQLQSFADKTAKAHSIHRNTAARIKSRLAKRLNKK